MTTLTVTCSCGAKLEVSAPDMASEVFAAYRYEQFIAEHRACITNRTAQGGAK